MFLQTGGVDGRELCVCQCLAVNYVSVSTKVDTKGWMMMCVYVFVCVCV